MAKSDWRELEAYRTMGTPQWILGRLKTLESIEKWIEQKEKPTDADTSEGEVNRSDCKGSV